MRPADKSNSLGLVVDKADVEGYAAVTTRRHPYSTASHQIGPSGSVQRPSIIIRVCWQATTGRPIACCRYFYFRDSD